MKNRKAVSLPINVLIVAALGLVVLIVIIAIFSGKIGMFTKSYDEQLSAAQKSCVAQGGTCKDSAPCETDLELVQDAKQSCETALQKSTAVCCRQTE